MHESAVFDTPVRVVEGTTGPVWIEALPAREYNTPFYGKVPITEERLNNFIKNFKENVRGQEIAIDFEHGIDPAKGNKAAGWYKDFKVAPSSDDPKVPALWANVEFTEEAKSEVKDKKWRYFSLEWEDEWQDNDGKKFDDVVVGGGLTNRPVAKRTLPINFSENMWGELDEEGKKQFADALMTALREKSEHKEEEHAEPGTGAPPEPRTDESTRDEPDVTGGWRQDTPPVEGTPQDKGGGNNQMEFSFVEKDARELFHALDMDSDSKPAEVVEAIKKAFGELKQLRDTRDLTEQEKKFAEQFPAVHAEHQKLMETNRENAAVRFSESVKTIRKAEGYGLTDTKQGLSTMAKEKIEEVHKKFAEGKATQADFEEVIKVIINGGIVQFGEIGSSGDGSDDIPEISTETPGGIAGAKKLFNEVLKKVQAEMPDKPFAEQYAEAAKKHPDLAAAAKVAVPS